MMFLTTTRRTAPAGSFALERSPDFGSSPITASDRRATAQLDDRVGSADADVLRLRAATRDKRFARTAVGHRARTSSTSSEPPPILPTSLRWSPPPPRRCARPRFAASPLGGIASSFTARPPDRSRAHSDQVEHAAKFSALPIGARLHRIRAFRMLSFPSRRRSASHVHLLANARRGSSSCSRAPIPSRPHLIDPWEPLSLPQPLQPACFNRREEVGVSRRSTIAISCFFQELGGTPRQASLRRISSGSTRILRALVAAAAGVRAAFEGSPGERGLFRTTLPTIRPCESGAFLRCHCVPPSRDLGAGTDSVPDSTSLDACDCQ